MYYIFIVLFVRGDQRISSNKRNCPRIFAGTEIHHRTDKMSGRQMTMNGKRPSSIPSRHQSETAAQHFDLIKYIYDSWNTVSRELDMCHNQPHSNSSNYRNGASVTYYQEREPNPQLKDFEPFNLEAWWGQRVVQSITRNANS